MFAIQLHHKLVIQAFAEFLKFFLINNSFAFRLIQHSGKRNMSHNEYFIYSCTSYKCNSHLDFVGIGYCIDQCYTHHFYNNKDDVLSVELYSQTVGQGRDATENKRLYRQHAIKISQNIRCFRQIKKCGNESRLYMIY